MSQCSRLSRTTRAGGPTPRCLVVRAAEKAFPVVSHNPVSKYQNRPILHRGRSPNSEISPLRMPAPWSRVRACRGTKTPSAWMSSCDAQHARSRRPSARPSRTMADVEPRAAMRRRARRLARAGRRSTARLFFRDVPGSSAAPTSLPSTSDRGARAQYGEDDGDERSPRRQRTTRTTFCGIFFACTPATAKVSSRDHQVRGQPGLDGEEALDLGGTAVTTSMIICRPGAVTKVLEKTHAPSFDHLIELTLDTPIRLCAGDTLGVYGQPRAGRRAHLETQALRTHGRRGFLADDGKLDQDTARRTSWPKPFGKRARLGGDALRQGRLWYGGAYLRRALDATRNSRRFLAARSRSAAARRPRRC